MGKTIRRGTKRKCGHPGCDKPAVFRRSDGSYAADDDHELCPRHFHAECDRARQKRRWLVVLT